MRISFKYQILFGCILVVVLILTLVRGILLPSLKQNMIDQVREGLFTNLSLMREVISDRWDGRLQVEELDALAVRISKLLSMRVTLIAPNGLVVGDSDVALKKIEHMENHINRPEIVQTRTGQKGWSIRHSDTVHVDFLYVADILGSPQDPRLYYRLALPLSAVDASLGLIRRRILWSSLIGVLLSFWLALLVAHQISRPLNKLTRTALKVASGDLTQRVRHYPQNEIGDLGRAFDRMAEHLQKEIESVTQARDRLDGVLRGMVEAVLVTDDRGTITLANQALVNLLHLSESPIGRTTAEIIRNPDLIDAIGEIAGGVPTTSLEITTLSKRPRNLDVTLSSLSGGEKSRFGVVAVFHDITERKRLEETRRDFVANVSHELRTPLASIRGAVETLLDGALSDPQVSKKFTQVIARHVLRLEDIVVDLLELARLESSKEEAEREEVDLIELAEESLEAVEELAGARQITLILDARDPELIFRADRRMLGQAMVNLLENGIKYSENGGTVTLGISTPGDQIEIRVQDTGIGISPEHLPRIFERFYRAEKSRSRDLGGTGLGLAIVKHVTQLHQGRVEVDSFPGRGSSFRLIFPA